MFSTITTFGTPREVTLSELAIETFYPADDHTAELLGTAAVQSSREIATGLTVHLTRSQHLLPISSQ